MKILLTGATGYIGKRLLPVLLNQGHQVVCCVRDRNRLQYMGPGAENVEILEIDFLDPPAYPKKLPSVDVAYYLIHSMSTSTNDFEDQEQATAHNFRQLMEQIDVKQVIYLGGIINSEKLSRHLQSRKQVEEILNKGTYHLTTLRAGIIVGSGSASFEIIRDLVEKLPVMITPKWVLTQSQPIAIRDVIRFLSGVIMHPSCLSKSFDIGGPNVLTYKEMLLEFARIRGLKRYILTVPVMTPRLSSYWLYIVTRVSYFLAVNLVNSMKVEVLCQNNALEKILDIQPMTYTQSVRRAFERIEQNAIISSWKDTFSNSDLPAHLSQFIEVPQNGCFYDVKKITLDEQETARVMENIWSIGGSRGWYYANWLWHIRGWLDRLVGGVGLRRGRTHPNQINPGDALDFWRVLFSDRDNKRLLLYAEMKLPGEAWLEFKIEDKNNTRHLVQTATFRPKGILGRLYWYATMPFHLFVFKGMLINLYRYNTSKAQQSSIA